MFGKFKHTNECQECGKLYQYNNYTEPKTCDCGGKLKYIGFQPEMDMLTLMTMQLSASIKGENTEQPIVINDNEKSETDNASNETNVNEVQCEENKVEPKSTITITEITSEEADKILEGAVNVQQEENDTTNQVIAFKLEDIIDNKGRVSNAQMIPAIKTALSEHSKEKIIMLKKNYPDVYESSLKYIGKKNTAILNELLA